MEATVPKCIDCSIFCCASLMIYSLTMNFDNLLEIVRVPHRRVHRLEDYHWKVDHEIMS